MPATSEGVCVELLSRDYCKVSNRASRLVTWKQHPSTRAWMRRSIHACLRNRSPLISSHIPNTLGSNTEHKSVTEILDFSETNNNLSNLMHEPILKLSTWWIQRKQGATSSKQSKELRLCIFTKTGRITPRDTYGVFNLPNVDSTPTNRFMQGGYLSQSVLRTDMQQGPIGECLFRLWSNSTSRGYLLCKGGGRSRLHMNRRG